MKAIATLILSVALCGFVSAAPITTLDSGSAVDVVSEETGNHNQGNGRDTIDDNNGNNGGGGGGSGATPEPATVALLGIGLGLAALRRKM